MGSRGPTRHHLCYGCEKMISPRKTHKCPGKPVREVSHQRFFADDSATNHKAPPEDQNC